MKEFQSLQRDCGQFFLCVKWIWFHLTKWIKQFGLRIRLIHTACTEHIRRTVDS